MINVTQRIDGPASVDLILELPFEIRQKSRFRAPLQGGGEAGVVLERGQVLRDGDLLCSDDGLVIEVRSAAESVSTVRSDDARTLARACYHLGNRHVPLQIGAGWVRYLHDHVLDGMAQALGLDLLHEHAPFEPEAGAYQGHTHHDHAH
ncbi:MAG: urease accessory protein UreE [Pseudomonadota bacterium]|nr:urease accessory protein UreE [Pseudomonadota bacterium]